MLIHLPPLRILPAALAALALVPLPGKTCAGDSPAFADVFSLIRSNLNGITEIDLNRAAVQGLLKELYPRVLLQTNPPATAATAAGSPLIARQQIFDRSLAHVRIGQVETGLAAELNSALDRLGSTNRLTGLVLDLRFASGWEYAEAGRTADRFLRDDRLLLRWGDQSVRSSAKTNAFRLPVVVLVNAETRGASEALAGVLRRFDVGLLLGGTTAGQAQLFKDIPLEGGQRLRIASQPVRLGDDTDLPGTGLKPDIEVAVKPDEERLYLDDSYRPAARSQAVRRAGSGSAASLTNRAIRITEADLVRMKRDGIDPATDDVRMTLRAPAPEVPQIADPALARAVDLLKGLAVIRTPR
jgi:hypothetical protein